MKDNTNEYASEHPRRRTKLMVALLAVTLVASFAVWGCAPKASEAPKTDTGTESKASGDKAASDASSTDELAAYSGFPTEGRFIDGIASLPGFYRHADEDAENATAEAPRRYTDRNGFTVQPVPSDELGWNNTYLDADNRGCTSCHTLESALMGLPTYHRLIFMGYPAEQSYQNCIACHSESYSDDPLADPIHTLHMNSTMFTKDDNGNCQSCHYIDSRTGVFERWDEVKYSVFKGYTDLASDEAKPSISYDQTTITPAENRFFKTVKDEPAEWLTDDTKVDKSIYENWVVSIDGECENPVEMTLPEMEKQFGTVKQVMKMDCTINGVGQATIMQSEVEGIPVAKIIEYAKPKAGANILSPISGDGYDYAQMSLQWLIDNEAVIVTKMDGELLPPSQGYPCMIWVNKTSGGNFTKRISNLTFMTKPADKLDSQLYVGQFTDDRTSEIYSKPNSGVLNYPTGVVLTGDEAKTVHLEGFADAWDEPIKKMEFSFDQGKTWTTLDTPSNNADFWTYWRMDFTPPAPGAYLLNIRTTSITPEGADRVCQYNTQFMFTVE
ncbi:MAG: molybdopterin-dependent oxidoreductase [Gordonibacter sp.]|uniref:molybdopterin-dependent oxidoreductase n=1 Tax=Gordonibacter sp. TaxID=1968902 RepID=UPI002FCA3E6A